MSDSLDRLREEFLAETEDTLDHLQNDLRFLEAARGAEPPADLVDRVFRTTHSLKGVAAMFGLDAMSAVAHALENVLDGVRQRQVALDVELLELLFRGHDVLHALRGSAREDPGAASAQSQEIIDALGSALRARMPESGHGPFEDTLAVLPRSEADAVRVAQQAGETLAVVEWELERDRFETQFRGILAAVQKWGRSLGTATTERDPASHSIVARTIVAGVGKSAEPFALIREVTPLGARVYFPRDRARKSVNPAPAVEAPAADEPRRPPASLRVPVDRIDRLLVELGELAQTTTNLEESIARTVDGNLQTQSARAEIRQALRAIDRRIRSLHDGVLGVRKVSLHGLFDRLERVFRDACRQSGKNARYISVGGDTELDRSIVEALSEPLVHLVRNAVDHGIEDSVSRRAAGKPEQGTVRVEARAEGDRLVLELSDDGAGVDHERVLERAKTLGLVAADEDRSVDERVALIFRARLSVKNDATALSGRGVGLDVVRESVVRLGGVLDVETGSSGSVFRLRLPRSLAVVAALDVECAGERYFVPLANVVRVMEVENADAERPYLEVRGRTVEVRELLPRSSKSVPRRRMRPAILLAVADRRALFLVDRVGRRRDIVVRPLGDWLGSIHGIAGCAETADGRSVLVLDPAALINRPLAAVEAAS